MSGYKIAKYEFTGDGSQLQNPGTTTDITDAVQQNCRSICLGCIKALMTANTQWQLDTDVPSSVGNVTRISTGDESVPYLLECLYQKSSTSALYSCGYYLVNSESGTKIAVLYIGNVNQVNHSYGSTFADNDTNNVFYATKTYNSSGDTPGIIIAPVGLTFAMIPAELNTTWTTYDWTASNWCVPNMISPISYCYSYIAATGTYMSYYYSCSSTGFYNTADHTYKWYIVANDDNIIFMHKDSAWTGTRCILKACFIGRLFQENFYESDTYHYGSFNFMGYDPGQRTNEGTSLSYSTSNAYTFNPFGYYISSNRIQNGFRLSGCHYYDSLDYPTVPIVQLCKNDGTMVAGISYRDYTVGDKIGYTLMCTSSGFAAAAKDLETKRYSPLGLGVASDSISIKGNDKFKGYIDTGLIRVVSDLSPVGVNTLIPELYTRGQTFNNGNFIYIGGGLVLGWDSSNTFNMFD